MKWIAASLLLWISAVALSAQSSTSLETEKIRIRKPVIPEIWYSFGSDQEPKAIGPTVQIRPLSQRPDLELLSGTPQVLELLADSTDNNQQNLAAGNIQPDSEESTSVTPGTKSQRDSRDSDSPDKSTFSDEGNIISSEEKPFVPTIGNLSGGAPSPASNPSVLGSSPAFQQTSSGSAPNSGAATGGALGNSAAAGYGSSESSYDGRDSGSSKDDKKGGKDDDDDDDDNSSGSSNGSAIDWSKNVQLRESTMVAVGEGVTLDIEGNVNLKGNQLRVGGAGNTDVSGKFTGSGTVQKSGSGVMTLYGKNSYQGDLVISEGTLLLGASNRLSDKIDVTLAGGSFNTGGFKDNVGELTLTRDSIIDLGDGESVLKFSKSASSEWTAGEVVEIRNWSGAAGGGGTDQIYAGSSNRGLTEQQLKQIEFFDPFGENSGRFPARILPTGEIVPAPEPSTILAALGALGWIGYREKRRLMDWFNKFRRTG